MLTHLQLFLSSILTGQPPMLVPTGAANGRRGATFIEYLLLAGLAVFLSVIIYAMLNDGFRNMLEGIKSHLVV